MEDKEFYSNNISCCSVELHWKNKNKEKDANDSYEYKLKQKEGNNFIEIYRGKENKFEVTNLIPNKDYTFKLKILEPKKIITQMIINIKTLNPPLAILSEKSDEIANGKNTDFVDKLTNSQIDIMNNCSKLIFSNEENVVKGDFDGIEIKITNEKENNINIHYISFDVKPNYFESFFNKFIEECENDIIIPCHFIIQKLPTILIFNLLEKGPVILTGKRMGGVIASSLAFYVFYIGKLLNIDINFGNAFKKREKNCIGVVTFGSPSFLNNLAAGIKMKEFAPYFINIKEEFDFIPVIIDFMNKKQPNYQDFLNIFEKTKLNEDEINLLKMYLTKKNKKIHDATKFKKIPFGFYYIMESKYFSLITVNENSFEKFYYFISSESINSLSTIMLYEKLGLNSKINFDKLNIEFLEKTDYKLDFIKIIRRVKYSNNKKEIKGIVKFKLAEIDHNIFSPDIIHKIILESNLKTYEINNKDIYYDNTTDITAYIDNLEENINTAFITNNFGGKMKAENIINIRGSGPTRKMIKDNIEKLFLIPFFKLIEIFNIILTDKYKGKYKELKEANFGSDFENINILEPFGNQIQILNELLFFSRPDILAKYEASLIKEYIKENLTMQQKTNFNNKLEIYYKKAKQLQEKLNINCLDSEPDSIAKKVSFPKKIKGNIQKLFMCECKYSENENFITQKLEDTYIKDFFIENLIKEVLKKLDDIIETNLNNKNFNFQDYLNNDIEKFYKEYITPNVYFIFFLILTSIESGDEIKFNHIIDKRKISWIIAYPFIWMKPFGEDRAKYEKDFKKYFKRSEIEQLNMRNLFHKIKIKSITDSNYSLNNNELNSNSDSSLIKTNKTFNFGKYSEKKISGKDYYEKFLEILNNYSNDFKEDIEIAIYDNLKEENKYRKGNFLLIIDMINDCINEEESKKGFLALLRQSYLLGKLRSDLVSIHQFIN